MKTSVHLPYSSHVKKRDTRLPIEHLSIIFLRPCLYEGEFSLVEGLPSMLSYLLPSVYMKRVVPAYRVKVDLA